MNFDRTLDDEMTSGDWMMDIGKDIFLRVKNSQFTDLVVSNLSNKKIVCVYS